MQDQILYAWLNMLEPASMETFFRCYPFFTENKNSASNEGEFLFDHTETQEIFSFRSSLENGFTSLEQLKGIDSIAQRYKEVASSLRLQAAEAIELAGYQKIKITPQSLYDAWLDEGFGKSLEWLCRQLMFKIKKLFSQPGAVMNKNGKVNIKVPFVNLSSQHPCGPGLTTLDFPRVRYEPWAFNAHPSSCLFELHCSYAGGKTRKEKILISQRS